MKQQSIKFIAYVASSIDGRIAKDNHSLVWTSAEDQKFFQDSLTAFPAVIVGHNTYKVFSKSLQKRNTIVFTSKVKKNKVVNSVVFLNPKYTNIVDFLNKNHYKIGRAHV